MMNLNTQGPKAPGDPVAGMDQWTLKREVTHILNRACEDAQFCQELLEKGVDALEDYPLPHEAKAAIASGDLQWLNDNVGELTQKQLVFIYKRHGDSIW
ncbi:MAG: hypothetical protein GX443_07490 [Deltaproteobacteria bacterium]|nr:hypothetical protein [Deltaproteobacteria bacterium]